MGAERGRESVSGFLTAGSLRKCQMSSRPCQIGVPQLIWSLQNANKNTQTFHLYWLGLY